MNIKDIVADLDEDTAVDLFWEMTRKFGWAGTFYARGDVMVIDDASDFSMDEPGGTTDAEWAVLSNSRDWRKYLVDAMTYDNEIPSIERREDGSFGINYVLGVQNWYDKDGKELLEKEGES